MKTYQRALGNPARDRFLRTDTRTGIVHRLSAEDVLAEVAVMAAGAVISGGTDWVLAAGQHETVTAEDTVDTGLGSVLFALASLEDDPVLTCDRVLAMVGDQDGAPASGSIVVKTFMPTATGDATPTAASTFEKKVSWIAIGTPKKLP